jgi:hypothetical protein
MPLSPVDAGSAGWIADYLVEKDSGFESELLESLTNLAARESNFSPLAEVVKTRLEA